MTDTPYSGGGKLVKQGWLKSAIFRSNYWIFRMIDDNIHAWCVRFKFLDEAHN